MPDALHVITIVSKPFEENSYIVHLPGENRCFVVDPGFEPELIFEKLDEEELDVDAILNTHGHVDHIAGNAAMKERYPDAPLIIGANDARMLTDPFANLSALGGEEVTSPPADHLVHHGQSVKVLGLTLETREIPGHSPGHVVFVWHDGKPPVVFGGDVLFAGSIGRVDFPGGNGPLLLEGIQTKMYDLPEETIVYPGHGYPTTIVEEKSNNPFTTGQIRL